MRLKIFKIRAAFSGDTGRQAGSETNYWRLAVEKTRTPLSFNHLIMRTRFLAGFVLLTAFAGGASAAVVMEKRSRQLPYVEVFECQGIHSFIFRGPTGTSRRPILVPPREYWTAREAGIYSFVLRYSSGKVCSRLVTPEVFARYQVGEHFYDRRGACAIITNRMTARRRRRSFVIVTPSRRRGPAVRSARATDGGEASQAEADAERS